MKKKDILSNPILAVIYNDLIKNCRFPKILSKTNKQVIAIIQSCLLIRLFEHYNIPRRFYFVTDQKAEAHLIAFLKEQHIQKKEEVTDEQLKKEVESIYELFDQVIINQATEKAQHE